MKAALTLHPISAPPTYLCAHNALNEEALLTDARARNLLILSSGQCPPSDIPLEEAWQDADYLMFTQLRARWRREKGAASAPSEVEGCPSYLGIIALGKNALRWILAEMKSEGDDPDHWFVALAAIAREDPVPEEAYGNMREMADAWFRWADKTMRGSWPAEAFPKLSSANHKITSPSTTQYNCIAWAADQTNRTWWPQSYRYWPPGVTRESTLDAFQEAFATLGYEQCEDASPEKHHEKIALYAIRKASGRLAPTHAARQLPDGRWTSKLGDCEDIEHESLEDLVGPCYGEPVLFLRRRRRQNVVLP